MNFLRRFILLALLLPLTASAQVTIPWDKITGEPTTAAGYGITNGANIDAWGAKTPYVGNIVVASGKTATISNTLTFSGTDSSVIAFGGNLTISGSSNLTFVTTGPTTLTVPTAGTLGTLAGAEVFTNKDLSAASNTYRAATTSVTGVVELATDAEAEAFTSTSLGVTPGAMGYALKPRFHSRKPADFLYSDGATTARRIETIYGSIGAIGGSDLTIVCEPFDVPTSNPSGTVDIAAFNSSNSADAGFAVNTLSVQLLSTGELRIRQNGSTNIADNRRFGYAGWRAAFSGRRVRLIVAFTGNSTTNPVVYQDGLDISASFTLTTENLGGGSVPVWVPASTSTTYFIQGFSWPAGNFSPGRPVNRKFAQADVDFIQVSGRLSAPDAAGGSAVVQTSGTLTIGRRYRIKTYVASDSFTNVGAGSNATGVEFVATGTTPTTWTNSSELVACGALSDPIIQPILVVADSTQNGVGSRIVGFIPVTSKRDWVIQASTNTNGNQQILGGSVFAFVNKNRIASWTINNAGTSKTVSLGNASGGTQYLSGGTAGAGLSDVTLATRFNGTVNLWVNSNGTDVLQHTIHGHGVN